MMVLDLIAAVAPERTAVVCGEQRLTYGELVERAERLAQFLISRGAPRLVCVAIEPSPWAPIAMMAALRAGAAYVPLDPSYPPARLADMLDQVGDTLILTTTSSSARLPPTRNEIVELDRPWDSATATLPAIPPDALAYVIFTSGSTGRPKGVMVPHRGLANLVATQIDVFEITNTSVVLQFAPLSFDASVSEVFTALSAGATLCLAPRDELVPGPRLIELCRRANVSVATLPPSSLALLEPSDFSTLRTIVSAGEACSAELVARWAPGRRFINAYGPTEVTVCATAGVCIADGKTPGIGAALSHCTVTLFDPELHAATEGEIFVGGVGVARGYLGRPDLTAERFVPDPAVTGGRMYRTGDLARVRDDGALEFLGRADHQVKVRGHRIELGEVEVVLRSAPRVRDALVIAREEHPGDVRIVGYVIGDPDLVVVRAAAEARLPAYARPTDLVVLAEWPRSPAGKIDRSRLPAPVPVSSRFGTGSARSEIELRLTEIWQHVLGISSVGPDDDFFALGGHSLLAINMLGRVRTELGADLPLSIVVERRTVAALAEAIASHGTRVELASPVRLRASTSGKQPLFLAPPITGSVLAYLPLVRRMAADRSVWAFHAPGLHGGRVRFDRFEDLATHYVDELVALQPRGPVMLGGWSMGGAFVIEMAIQLAQRHYEVSTMVLIDAGTPTSYMAEQINDTFGELDDERMAYMYVNNFGRCFGMDLGLDPKQFAGIPASERAKVALAELRRVPAFPPDMDLDRLAAHIAVFTATGQRFIRYLPVGEKFNGRVVHFMARDGHPEFGRAAYRYDWSDFVEQKIETIEVPGTHFSLVNEPHVATLGAELDRVLADLP